MVLARIILATIVAALLAGAYWGTDALAAAKPKSQVHCLVFRWALVNGTHWVLLDQKPIGEIPCPGVRTQKA